MIQSYVARKVAIHFHIDDVIVHTMIFYRYQLFIFTINTNVQIRKCVNNHCQEYGLLTAKNG